MHALAPAAIQLSLAVSLLLTRRWEQETVSRGAECAFVCMCVCGSSYHTGAETHHLHPRHHLHSPFPACRVIPAPALPPLPSHTYQPPAAVPLPESGSSSLDTVDKQQQLIHLSLCVFPCCSHSLTVRSPSVSLSLLLFLMEFSLKILPGLLHFSMQSF